MLNDMPKLVHCSTVVLENNMNTIKLTKREYEILKKIDFSEIEGEVLFNDQTFEFTNNSEIADIIFNEFIVNNGLDKDYNCTELGQELYQLHDKLFL